MMRTHILRRGVAPVVLGVTFGLVMPAQGFAKALIRFVHGVPGVGTATVSVTQGGPALTVGSIGFGQATAWKSIRSGGFHWALTGGGKTLARGTATVGHGAYDIVVLERKMKVRLGIYKARAGRAGTGLVRVIHAAAEFGSPELMVDGKAAITSLAYTRATPYVALTPGAHTLAAVRRGSTKPLISATATVSAGKSYSAVVLGTRGERVRVLTLVDRGGPAVSGAGRDVATHGSVARSRARARTVVVRPGDSLWSIARSLVGGSASNETVERRLVRIWDANAARIGTGDPNLIYPGTTLAV